MPLHTVKDLLARSDELKALAARARRLRDLQTLFFRAAPRELAAASRVKDCRAGTLVVAADHAAIASKLRQLAPRILASISKTEPQITSLRVEVQVGGGAEKTLSAHPKKPLTPAAVDEFEALSKRLPEGQLKHAVANLVQRRKRGG